MDQAPHCRGGSGQDGRLLGIMAAVLAGCSTSGNTATGLHLPVPPASLPAPVEPRPRVGALLFNAIPPAPLREAPVLTASVSQSLDPAQVAHLLRLSGFPKAKMAAMICTARHESGLRPAAKNLNDNGTQDTGLFQINDVWLTTCHVTRDRLLDPTVNSACAVKVFGKRGLAAWTAYHRWCRRVLPSYH